jgi:hypothetical protein
MLSELFVERFWLRRAERRARGYAPAQVGRIRALSRATRARAQAGLALRSPGETGPAFLLLKEAFAFSLTAWLVARGEHDAEAPLAPVEAWQRLEALAESGVAVPSREKLGAILGSGDPLAADRLSARDALAARAELEALLRFLGAEVELRSVRSIRVFRVLRLLGVVFAFLALYVATLTFALAPPTHEQPRVGARFHRR